jgi:hypothetical protein
MDTGDQLRMEEFGKPVRSCGFTSCPAALSVVQVIMSLDIGAGIGLDVSP